MAEPTIRRIARDHPAIAGHFPGDPLVPGVLILEEVYAEAIAAFGPGRLIGFRSVKFLAPLRPEDEFQVVLTPEGGGRYDFACRRGERILVQGRLQLQAEPVTR